MPTKIQGKYNRLSLAIFLFLQSKLFKSTLSQRLSTEKGPFCKLRDSRADRRKSSHLARRIVRFFVRCIQHTATGRSIAHASRFFLT